MASGSITSLSEFPASADANQVRDILQSNCRQLKLTDLAVWASRLLSTATTLLLLAFLIDHWAYLLSSTASLGSIGRWVFFLTLFVLLPAACITNLVGHLRRHINPLFAAEQIELDSPEIKNSISNYWQLRDPSSGVHPSIQEAMAVRANLDLTDQRIQNGVDIRGLSRWGYSGLAVLAVTAIYFAFMPRPSMQTIHRILIPWDHVQRPSEILITHVNPGDVEVDYGKRVRVTAEVDGITKDDDVKLLYRSTNDSLSQQFIRMTPQAGTSLFTATLGNDSEGIQQDFEYWILAGDLQERAAESEHFTITAIPAPHLQIQSIQYDFPAYTRTAQSIVTDQFNIDAIEGTTVTISAKSNQPIASAMIRLFNADQREPHRQPMTTTGSTTCQYQFALALSDNLDDPQYSHYELSFTTTAGGTNTEPIRYAIRVQRDLPPVTEFITPSGRQIDAGPIQLPVNRSLPLHLKTHDPDYGLENINLTIQPPEQPVTSKQVFHDPQGAEGLQLAKTTFRPQTLGIMPGSRVVLSVEATDNRRIAARPEPNLTHSRQIIVHVVDPVEGGDESGDSGNDADDTQNGTADPTNNQDPQQQNNSADGDDNQKNSDPADGGTGGSSAEKGEASTSEATGDGQSGNPKDEDGGASKSSVPDGQGENSKSTDQTGTEKNMSDSNEPGSEPNPTGGSQNTSNTNEPAGSDQGGTPQNSESGMGDPENATHTGEPGDTHSNGNRKPSGETTGRPDDDLHDGDVFERTLNHLREKELSQGNSQSEEHSQQQDNAGDPRQENNPLSENRAGEDSNDQTGNRNSQPNPGHPTEQQNTNQPQNQNNNGGSDSNNSNGSDISPSNNPSNEPANGTGGQATTSKTTGESNLPEETTGNGAQQPSETTQQSSNFPNEAADTKPEHSTGETVAVAGGEQPGASQGGSDNQNDQSEANDLLNKQEQEQLQYTRKATDLALDYLKDQQHEPDQELLDNLGITAEQLREMVARYAKLKRDQTPAGKRTLDDTLRSLGLRPPINQDPRAVHVKTENISGVRNSGVVSGLPVQLRQQFRSFRKGTSVSDE